MTDILQVTWKDHYSSAGWFEKGEVRPEGHVNISVGFMVQEDDDYLTLAQTCYKDGDTVADVLHIIKNDILISERLHSEDSIN